MRCAIYDYRNSNANTPKCQKSTEVGRRSQLVVDELNYNMSFEFLAERFYRETGLMAPGKDAPPGIYQNYDERRESWQEFMRERSEEAWVLWHQKYGYLKDA